MVWRHGHPERQSKLTIRNPMRWSEYVGGSSKWRYEDRLMNEVGAALGPAVEQAAMRSAIRVPAD